MTLFKVWSAVRRDTVMVLVISLAIALIWPLTTYIIYPIPHEDVEFITNISDFAFPERPPPGFLIGVGGLLTFRGSGFEFKGVAISARGDIAIIKLESGETIAMLFMPRYRCIGVEGVLSGYELAKFIANKSAVVKGHMFLTRGGYALIPLEVIVENRTCIAIFPHRR